MKPIFLVICFIIISFNNLFPQFRGTKWGFNQIQVKRSESSEPVFASKDELNYYENNFILSKNVLITYEFLENKLFSAGYMIDDREVEYIDFIIIKGYLEEKYGVNKNNPNALIADWETEDTKITLIMQNKKGIGIIYKSKKYAYLIEERLKRGL